MGKYNAERKRGLIPFRAGQSGNPNGRPRGSKNLSTIIRELEDEQFNWRQLPIKDQKQMEELVNDFGSVGSPFRVIVYKALMDSIFGKGIEKIAAREWLRRSCYGNKLEIDNPFDKRETREPIIMSHIKPRFNNTNS